MVGKYVIPPAFEEGKRLVLARVTPIVARGNVDELAFVRGWISGAFMAHVIGIADLDDMRDAIPELYGYPFDLGPEVAEDEREAPDVAALTDDDVLHDRWFSLWVELKNMLHRTEGRGGMPRHIVLAWLGFLFAHAQVGDIRPEKHDELRRLLPSVQNDPTPRLAPQLTLDELVVARGKKHFWPPPTIVATS